MNEFCAGLADVLDVPQVTSETRFRELDGWCSLKAFGLLIHLENEYHVSIPIETFLAFNTIADLARACKVS